ncbi:lipase family protein [Sphaerotilaceae bacterium SBD11-9]
MNRNHIPHTRTSRAWWIAAAFAAVAAGLCAGLSGCGGAEAAPPPALPAGPAGANFWEVPPSVPAGAQRGDIYWAQERSDAPTGSRGWNVVYVSEITTGRLAFVSGEIYLPSAASSTPRDVVLWNHETTGNADACAPSRRNLAYGDGTPRVPALAGLLAKGHAVVMSDYPGLGLDGPTFYMAGEPNARASLDMLRVARNFPGANVSTRFAMYGWSQGGQTTLWASSIAASYASEFQPLGGVLIAPAGRILDLTLNSMTDTSLAGYVISTLPGIRSLFPSLQYGDFLTVEGLEQFPAMTDGCFDVFGAAATVQAPYQPNALVPGSPWYAAMSQVDSFHSVREVPMLILQGSVDDTTPVRLTARLRGDLCAAGAAVDYRESPGLSHLSIVPVADGLVPGWIDARFKGQAAASNCP